MASKPIRRKGVRSRWLAAIVAFAVCGLLLWQSFALRPIASVAAIEAQILQHGRFASDPVSHSWPGESVRGVSWIYDGLRWIAPAVMQRLEHPRANYRVEITNADADDRVLRSISELPSVSAVRIARSRFSDSGIQRLAECRGLTELSIRNTPVTDGVFAALGKLPALSSLAIANTRIQGHGLNELQNLERLSVSGASFTSGGLQSVSDLARLRGLSLDVRFDADDVLSQIATLTQLTGLSISGTSFDGDALTELGDLKKLKSLRLVGTSVDDEALASLTGWEQLQFLQVTDAPAGNGITSLLTGCPALERLELVRTSATDMTLQTLGQLQADGRLPNLKLLSLIGTQTTARGIASLNLATLEHLSLPQLRQISPVIAQCESLISLSAANCDLTADDLRVLGGLADLKILDISGCQLSQEAWQALCRLPSLKRLFACRTDITADHLDALGSAMSQRFSAANLYITVDDCPGISATEISQFYARYPRVGRWQ